MKIDLNKELRFQRDQFLAMFHGLGEELALTLAVVTMAFLPVILIAYILDLAVRSF